jgi:hypothetical protein
MGDGLHYQSPGPVDTWVQMLQNIIPLEENRQRSSLTTRLEELAKLQNYEAKLQQLQRMKQDQRSGRQGAIGVKVDRYHKL